MKSISEYIMKHLNEALGTELATPANTGCQSNGFCILKPQFMNYKDDFLSMLNDNGWTIQQSSCRKLTRNEAEQLYKSLAKKDFYNDLCDYMICDDCLCCACHKDCKDPVGDLKQLKHGFRDKYGIDEMRNGMHSSDNAKNVDREIEIVFGKKLDKNVKQIKNR